MDVLAGIRAVMVDLDGTLYIGDTLVPGAVAAIHALKDRGLAIRFVTNTTTISRGRLLRKLQRLGLPVEPAELITPAVAANRYIDQHVGATVLPVVCDELKPDFASMRISEVHPDFLVIGYMGRAWDFDLIERLFHLLLKGSKLLCLHKSRFSQRTDGRLGLDIGPFVAALEYAAATHAEIMGKPSPNFFSMAVDGLDFAPDEIAMIGDDPELDVDGAMRLGFRGIQVRTGKYRPEWQVKLPGKPDFLIGSIADLV